MNYRSRNILYFSDWMVYFGCSLFSCLKVDFIAKNLLFRKLLSQRTKKNRLKISYFFHFKLPTFDDVKEPRLGLSRPKILKTGCIAFHWRL